MRTIEVWIETNLIGSRFSDEIEVEDTATDADIDAEVREWMFNHIEWGWKSL